MNIPSYRAALRSPHVIDFEDFELVFLPSNMDLDYLKPSTYVQGAVRLKVVDGVPESIERFTQEVDYRLEALTNEATMAYRSRQVPEQTFIMRVWNIENLKTVLEMFPVLDHIFYCNLGTRKPFSIVVELHDDSGKVITCLERYYQFGSVIPVQHACGSMPFDLEDRATYILLYDLFTRWLAIPSIGQMEEMNHIMSTYLEHIDGFEDLNSFWEEFWSFAVRPEGPAGIKMTPNTLPSWMFEHYLMTDYDAFDAGHHVTLALIMKHFTYSGLVVIDCQTSDGTYRSGPIFTTKEADYLFLKHRPSG